MNGGILYGSLVRGISDRSLRESEARENKIVAKMTQKKFEVNAGSRSSSVSHLSEENSDVPG